jgi:UDP-N-acetylmuramyl pentapeptide phosphotransferase/UDP-N-acetylglucosamine-1-phosphate transferase
LSLQAITILGIGDDLLDIRWRHKVLIPAFAAIPMLIVYFIDFGVTYVVVPIPLQRFLGSSIDLGWMYYAYMAAVAIFCPNGINMLAGINGLEVAQSIAIAVVLLMNDALFLAPITPYPHPAMDSHLFSIYFLTPFIAVSLALLYHNWFPARVFVGDTYCYFAGMVFAVVGILGHFSKTLMLLLVPQAFNFVYSTPQLFGLIPCPRHRFPKFNPRSGLLEPSMAEWAQPPPKVITIALEILQHLRLVRLTRDENGEIVESSNLTLLNLWLLWFGPLREDRLTLHIVGLQFGWGIIGLLIRHKLALLVFQQDNRPFA